MKVGIKRSLVGCLSVLAVAMSMQAVYADEDIVNQQFTGNPVEPSIAVLSDTGVQLTKGTDYDLSYENNINVGTDAKVIVNFKGNYSGQRTVNFEIVAKPVTDIDSGVTVDEIGDQVFTGSQITPEPVVKVNGTALTKDVDYTVTYGDNINVGTNAGSVKVTFIKNYSDDITKNFNILPKDLSTEAQFSAIADENYTGLEITPTPTVSWGAITLVAGTDFDFRYEDNTNVGVAKVYADFKGNYTGTASTTFNIVQTELTNDTAKFDPIPDQIYTGSEIKPAVTIKLLDGTVITSDNYDLEYSNNINVGNATVKAKFKGNYRGEATTTFKIVARDVSSDANIVIEPIPAQTYTGSEIKPEPVIKDISR